MALTALQVVQSALGEIGKTFPATILSTTVSEQILLRNLLYAQSRQLRSKAYWPTQKKTYSFDLESSRSRYPLPADFFAFVANTEWDSDSRLRLRGPKGDGEFTIELYGTAGGLSPVAFRVHGPDGNIAAGTAGGQFQISPTPSASGETLVFEYYTRNLFIPPYWTASETGITTSKYRSANGNIYKCSAITTGTCGTTPPSHTSGTAVDGGVTWQFYSTPYETIIADEDLSLFDDSIMVCGMKWRYLKAKGLDFDIEAQEYQTLLGPALTRWKGTYSGMIGENNKGAPRYAPRTPGSWSF